MWSFFSLKVYAPHEGNRFLNFEGEVDNRATLCYAAQGDDVYMGGEVSREGARGYSSTGLNQQKGELLLQTLGCRMEFLCNGENKRLFITFKRNHEPLGWSKTGKLQPNT